MAFTRGKWSRTIRSRSGFWTLLFFRTGPPFVSIISSPSSWDNVCVGTLSVGTTPVILMLPPDFTIFYYGRRESYSMQAAFLFRPSKRPIFKRLLSLPAGPYNGYLTVYQRRLSREPSPTTG